MTTPAPRERATLAVTETRAWSEWEKVERFKYGQAPGSLESWKAGAAWERSHRTALLIALLKSLEPHLDAIVCYASTCGEHEPNNIVKQVREVLAQVEAA